MEKLKLCASCGKNLGQFTCMKCGRLVCGACFDFAKGVCRGCLSRFK